MSKLKCFRIEVAKIFYTFWAKNPLFFNNTVAASVLVLLKYRCF